MLTEYCAAVGYDPYLHDDNIDCIPDNIYVFIPSAVTNIAKPLPLHTSPPPEGET